MFVPPSFFISSFVAVRCGNCYASHLVRIIESCEACFNFERYEACETHKAYKKCEACETKEACKVYQAFKACKTWLQYEAWLLC